MSNNIASANDPTAGFSTGAATVTSTGTIGAGGSVTSTSTVDNPLVTGSATATQIATTCTSSEAGRSAGPTTVNNLVIQTDTGPQTLNGAVPANTTYTLAGGLGTVTVNEQILTDTTTTTAITVNGLHIITAAGTDIVIAESQCSLAGDALAPALAVSFRSFSAHVSKSGVAVRWQTASETDLVGFNVYQQKAGARVRVNTKLIAASSRASGRTYSFVDRSLKGSRAAGARYWIQAVHADGSRTWFGPARVAGGRIAH